MRISVLDGDALAMRLPFPLPLRSLCLATAAATVLALFYLGGQPFAADLIPAPWDKLAHFFAYGGITLLIGLGFARGAPLQLIVLAGAIGALDEWHQMYVPGRSAGAGDWLTDVAAGVAAAALIEWLRARGTPRRRATDARRGA